MNLKIIKDTYEKQPFAFQKRASASLHILDRIDDVLASFSKRKSVATPDILLDVYGLFQSLFVGIDALYDLVIGTTQYKHHININSNPVLRELKYIRNDIVGHPTHRTYDDGMYGFSMIRESDLTRETLIYDTYIVSKKETITKSKTICFKELINNFIAEKNIILDDLVQFINSKPKQNNLVGLTYSLLNKALLDEYNLIDLETISDAYAHEYDDDIDDNHRFVWRLQLLNKLFEWQNRDWEEYVNYLRKYQAYKLYEIACDINEISLEKIHIPIPKVLVQFYHFLRKHPYQLHLLDNLADVHHPLFQSDVEQLLSLHPPKQVIRLLKWLLSFEDGDYVQMIGTSLKAYKKK